MHEEHGTLFSSPSRQSSPLISRCCRVVYKELGKYGDLDNQVLCRERLEELEPSSWLQWDIHFFPVKLVISNAPTNGCVSLYLLLYFSKPYVGEGCKYVFYIF
ncbi:hypothetical protein L1987_80621 [Smallanthus sonchifolius]|uniref:Uncharacterized protein n=1 Tax=Smallanthus sonchifolius TaxID=185202 RepID=A0ACB8YN79_9ASTR|nr:hypothetical protein L1987_80621 [Smallanthus sonchifolius]